MSFAAHVTPTAVSQSAGTSSAGNLSTGFLADIGDGAATSPHHATGRAATSCAGLLADRGMRHTSTALYFYGASKKTLHKPRVSFGNMLFKISYSLNYNLQFLF
jgi:hypothetical protein